MDRVRRSPLCGSHSLRASAGRPGLRRLPLLALLLCPVGLGCGPDVSAVARSFSMRPPAPAVTRASPAERDPPEEGETLPQPHTLAPSTGKPPGAADAATPSAAVPFQKKVLPLSLETIFRLAEEQNPQVKLAREQVATAVADLDLARLSWVPKVYAGPAYYRHEGGIQDQTGQLIHSSTGALFAGFEVDALCDVRDATFQRVRAEREVWQQKGELSRISHANLLQASSAYMDLLAARTGEAVLREIDTKLQSLREYAEGLGNTVPQAPVELIRAEADANQMALLKLRQLAEASSAQLAYLLGVAPGTQFEPVDAALAPFALVDASPPLEVLVERAVHSGPGVREVEGLLELVHNTLAQLNGPCQYAPVLELRMAEGPFGAGPGASLAWDNRFDVALQARWNLGGLATAKQVQRAAETRLAQAQLTLDDLRAKLSAGVQEARETVLGAGGQIRHGQQVVEHAEKSYQLLDELLRGTPMKDRTLGDVLRALLAIKQAQQEYLTAINAYDKAQLRLLLLLGPAEGHH